MHNYLQKAINNYDDIGPLKFLNVIRICRGQNPIRQGVEGDSHYATVACRERDILSLFDNVDIVEETDADLEAKEIEEIASEFDLKI